MRIIETKAYRFTELSDAAKEAAREWYRLNCSTNDDWWDPIYDDADNIGLIITNSGVDGNNFAAGHFAMGAYDCAVLTIANHGERCETYKLASTYLAEYKKLGVDEPANENEVDAWEEQHTTLAEQFQKDMLDEYASMLQKEYEMLLSDEFINEMLEINEYEFDEAGKRI